jgi:hypothetical protein
MIAIDARQSAISADNSFWLLKAAVFAVAMQQPDLYTHAGWRTGELK